MYESSRGGNWILAPYDRSKGKGWWGANNLREPSLTTAASLLLVIGVGGAAVAGGMIPKLPQIRVLAMIALIAIVIGAGMLLKRGGLSSVTSAALMTGASFMAMNSLRITSSVAIADIFLLIAGVLLIPSLAMTSARNLRHFKLLSAGIALMMVGGVIGSVTADDPLRSLANLARFGVAAILVPLIVALWAPKLREITAISWMWVLSSAISAIVAASEVLRGTTNFNDRADGLASHPNQLAMTAVIAIGPAIALTIMSRPLMRLFGLCICAVLCIGVLLSGSRAGVLGLGTELLILAVLTRRRAIVIILITSVLIAMLLISNNVIVLPEGNAVGRFFGSQDTRISASVAGSNAARIRLIYESFDQIRNNPFWGNGFDFDKRTHNLILQIWYSAGILGLTGLMFVINAVVRLPMQRLLRSKHTMDRSARLLLVGLVSGFGGFLITAVFQPILWERYMWMIPALIVALSPYTAVEAKRRGELFPVQGMAQSPEGRPKALFTTLKES